MRIFLVFCLAYLSLLGCARSPDNKAEIRWKLASDSREMAFLGMDCFFLSVSGQEIEESLEDGALGTFMDRSCLDLGQVSPLVDRSTLITTGVTLSVPRGSNRRIRAIGLRVPGGNCEPTVSAQFAQSLPTMYTLGEKTQDLIKKIEVVQIPNQIPGAKNLVATCGDIKQFLYSFTLSGTKVERVPIDPMTGSVSGPAVNTISPALGMCTDPRGQYIGIVNSSTFALCEMGNDGSSINCNVYFPPGSHTTTHCQFAPDGGFFYIGMSDASTSHVRVYSVDRPNHGLTFQQESTDVAGSNTFTTLDVSDNAVYASVGSGSVILPRDPNTGSVGNRIPDPFPLFKYIFHPFLGRGYGIKNFTPTELRTGLVAPMTKALTFTTTTDFGFVGGSDTIGSACITPNGKYLYAHGTAGSSRYLRRHNLGALGALSGGPITEVDATPLNMISCLVHESGDRLYIANGGNGTFTAYPIAEDGSLGVAETTAVTGPKTLGILTLPQ